MKKSVFFILWALVVGVLLFAQNRNPGGGPDPRWQTTPPKTVRVTGTLGVVQGKIALQDKDTTYYVFGLERFIGFIEGLKEGATVSIDGYAQSSPSAEFRFLRATKLTLNNKDYDLVPAEPQFSQARPDFSYPPHGWNKSRGHHPRKH
ncbi:MAG: hypothetical protein LBQ30_06045 [Treponema sp.]|jgi:hypothetical protein|nr:hypothetical protein [Treponema sp.]